MLRVEIDENSFMEVTNIQWTLEFQNSYIRQILPAQLLSRWGDIPSASYSTITPKSSRKNFINQDVTTILPASSPKLANFITCPGQYLTKMIQLLMSEFQTLKRITVIYTHNYI